jgi:transposase-like protein
VTGTLENVAAEDELDQQQLAEQLLAQAKEQGVDLVGPKGLLNQLTKKVLETALEEEMADHLGYEKHDPAGRNRGIFRSGVRAKTVLTERSGRDRGAPRHRSVVPAADREEAAAPADRGR